jgi:Cys-rich repeat protein
MTDSLASGMNPTSASVGAGDAASTVALAEMTHSRSFTRIALLSSLFAAACGSDPKSKLGSGTGGAIATGGASAGPGVAGGGGGAAGSDGDAGGSGGAESGGDTSSGGALVASGGTASGGATSSGGASTAGAAGAEDGGTLSPDGGAPPASCRTNADCANVAGTPLCEAASGKCIACHTNAQCSVKEECTSTVCTKLPECQNSLDCASAPGGKSICDKANGVCVQCTADADCGAGRVCTDRVCRTSCGSDNDCTAQHMLCNQGITFGGQCTECVVSADCKSGEYCESGSCVPQTCKPAQQSCDGNLVVQCNDTGSGVTPLTQCTLALFSSCVLDGDNAKCVGQCEDKKKDGFETDVDCGGPACQRCTSGKACVLPTDCSSNQCTSSKCK